ncbi:hypothetical protein [Actinomadura sp. NEAU-AAG7]|uniref:hypothetical protein n=1 Tax=Actinomadura sp. NEAU-AAG7 TaxID=2839640 RepID=UPI001BE3ED44|nr:hypothetical protein [Actinomadura sp. NEAU-AAG7]MBT2211620.1 hypothetical protein [Actinomadura sp. NEAU-AAG7]
MDPGTTSGSSRSWAEIRSTSSAVRHTCSNVRHSATFKSKTPTTSDHRAIPSLAETGRDGAL